MGGNLDPVPVRLAFYQYGGKRSGTDDALVQVCVQIVVLILVGDGGYRIIFQVLFCHTQKLQHSGTLLSIQIRAQ